jgi:hypothetical protein
MLAQKKNLPLNRNQYSREHQQQYKHVTKPGWPNNLLQSFVALNLSLGACLL